jgi:hypothetical protein
MDVGQDYLTLGVGSSWPAGVMEMRKHDNYIVRLDKSISSVPLRAQRMSLDKLRKGKAGYAANTIVQSFYDSSTKFLETAKEMPSHFDDEQFDNFDNRVRKALDDAISHMSFKPNESQQDAVTWALKRKVGMIRGPPGTGEAVHSSLASSCEFHRNDIYFERFQLNRKDPSGRFIDINRDQDGNETINITKWRRNK